MREDCDDSLLLTSKNWGSVQLAAFLPLVIYFPDRETSLLTLE